MREVRESAGLVLCDEAVLRRRFWGVSWGGRNFTVFASVGASLFLL